MRTSTAWAVAAVLLAWGPLARAEEPPEVLASRLAALRAEVEELAKDLDAEREQGRLRLQALAAQRTEVDADVRREELRVQELDKAVAEARAEVEAESQRDAAYRPLVDELAAALKKQIRSALPHATTARIAEVDAIVERVRNGLLGPRAAIARLWDRVEDELRLARDIGLYREVVFVDGYEVLAEVARIGGMALLYQTEEGRVGYAKRAGDAWAWMPLPTLEDKERVGALFDGLRKQIRTGRYVLPGAALAVLP